MSSGRHGRASRSARGSPLLAAAAFLRGSLLVDGPTGEVVALRMVGVVAVLIGSLMWRDGGLARQVLWAGLLAVAVAAYAQLQDSVGLGDALLVVGSANVLACVLTASRRSLAARVAASAAGVLLLMVLVLSLALSAVLSSTVEHEASVRLDARARTEVGLLSRESEIALRGARSGRAVDRDQSRQPAVRPRTTAGSQRPTGSRPGRAFRQVPLEPAGGVLQLQRRGPRRDRLRPGRARADRRLGGGGRGRHAQRRSQHRRRGQHRCRRARGGAGAGRQPRRAGAATSALSSRRRCSTTRI